VKLEVGLGLSLVLAACAAPQARKPLEEEPFVLSPAPPPRAAEELALAGTRGRTPIERIGASRRVPLVHATIAGRPAMLLLDTGAFDHILEGWFAHELADAEASGKSANIIDHANRKVPVDAWSPVLLALDGWGPVGTIRPLATRDQTPGPRALGIGGLLSPQRLAGTGSPVVIDFVAAEMTREDEPLAAARLAARRLSLGTAIRCGASYIVAGAIEGRDARLLVDTGAGSTDLKASSAPGRALAGRSAVSREIYAIGGAVTTRILNDATVAIGALTLHVDVPLVDDTAIRSRCASDGVVGMDVLGTCVLVLEPTRMRIACD